MSEFILKMIVYLISIVFVVSIIDVGIALFQIIEDRPIIRRRIWSRRTQIFSRIRRS
jgi:hypothetical protein